jgi:molecular chaperone HscB
MDEQWLGALVAQPFLFGNRMTGKTETAGCSYCGAPSGSDPHFCDECGRLQPLGDDDYFTFFGLPRKLMLDEAALQKEFYRLSRRLHPDYFMGASEQEKLASVARSSMLNDAYRTLIEPVSRIQYLLSLEGFKEAEKKAPPDLLEEIFELNMQVEELKTAKRTGDRDEVDRAREALASALAQLEARLGRIDADLLRLAGKRDEAETSQERDRSLLQRMSEILSQRSYINNLVRDVSEEIG